jgi:hypothetical protein
MDRKLQPKSVQHSDRRPLQQPTNSGLNSWLRVVQSRSTGGAPSRIAATVYSVVSPCVGVLSGRERHDNCRRRVEYEYEPVEGHCRATCIIIRGRFRISLACANWSVSQPGGGRGTCRCLCFGFLLHIMYTYFFFRLTALHPSQSLLTEVRTCSGQPRDDVQWQNRPSFLVPTGPAMRWKGLQWPGVMLTAQRAAVMAAVRISSRRTPARGSGESSWRRGFSAWRLCSLKES